MLGFRSGLEEVTATSLRVQGVAFDYEKLKIKFVHPARLATYTPDFVLRHNGIVVETKGRFQVEDREKHLLVRQQHLDLDIRFVFSRSKTPIRTGSPTTYADWCRTHGFQFADKTIPQEWIEEPSQPQRHSAIERATVAPSMDTYAWPTSASRKPAKART